MAPWFTMVLAVYVTHTWFSAATIDGWSPAPSRGLRPRFALPGAPKLPEGLPRLARGLNVAPPSMEIATSTVMLEVR